ncbi:hypothetical protein EDD85DRAFT_813095 [Armillaria nabsnona]|nr:hypothetical protein EDD85DRAFT_813095 [Armillaria nabsnona]
MIRRISVLLDVPKADNRIRHSRFALVRRSLFMGARPSQQFRLCSAHEWYWCFLPMSASICTCVTASVFDWPFLLPGLCGVTCLSSPIQVFLALRASRN